MDYVKLNLFYPNQRWRSCVGDLVDESDKKFNWFSCAKKYRGKDGVYLVQIAKNIKFYSKETGVSYILREPATLTIDKNIHTKDYDGYAVEDDKVCSPNEELLCQEVTFYFKPGAISEFNTPQLSSYSDCDIISYSKRNHDLIKAKVKDFPPPKEIDEILKIYPCSIVSRVLYDYIKIYLGK